MVQAIAPGDVAETKAALLPDGVIETWNALIAKNFTNGRTHVQQNEAVVTLMEKMSVDRQYVFEMKWLDIEEVYREQGWLVAYDKPAYNESYEASFTFTAK